MRTYSKLILAALAASAILALAVGSASAGRFSTTEKNFEIIWNRTLSTKTALSFVAAGNTVSCNVTLLGGFTGNTIAKRTGIDQGTIRHGELEGCTGGTATIRTETMPWTLRYNSFTGSLPRIRSISTSLIRATFGITAAGTRCEAGTTITNPGVGIIGESRATESGLETTGEPENITAEEGNRIPLRGVEFLCGFAGNGEFIGRGLIRNLPQTGKIKITLI